MDGFFGIIIVIAVIAYKVMQAAGRSAQNASRPQPPVIARPNPAATQSTRDEQERLRKFLEALGVPAGQLPPSAPPPGEVRSVRPAQAVPPLPRETAAPQPPAKRKSYPRTPPVADPVAAGRKIPPFMRKEAPVLIPTPEPEPAAPREYLPAAPTPEFTESSDGLGRMNEMILATDPAPAVPLAPARSRLNEFLRNPDDLRRAIILREIFNPPKGLQFPDDAINSRLV